MALDFKNIFNFRKKKEAKIEKVETALEAEIENFNKTKEIGEREYGIDLENRADLEGGAYSEASGDLTAAVDSEEIMEDKDARELTKEPEEPDTVEKTFIPPNDEEIDQGEISPEEMSQEENIYIKDAPIDDSIMQQFNAFDNSMPEEDEDFEETIKRLNEEADAIELGDFDFDIVKDIDIYDTVENSLDDVKEKIAKQLENDKNKSENQNLVFLIIIGVLILATIGAGLFLVLTLENYKRLKHETVQQSRDILPVPDMDTNTAHFIYTSKTATFDDREIKISKILLDSVATVIYFDTSFSAEKYNIFLADNKGTMYNMDLSFAGGMNEDEKKEQTVLYFEPVNQTAKSLNLTMNNPGTGENIEIPFEFSAALTMPPAKYLNSPVTVDGLEGGSLIISDAIFSSSVSRINYKIKWDRNSRYELKHGSGKYSNYMILKEGIRERPKIKKHPAQYSFDDGDTVIGRMDFERVHNLNSKVTVKFTDLYKNVPLDINLTEEQIAGGYSFEIDNQRVVLEGLRRFDNNYVLVLHGEDTAIQNPKPNSYKNRVEVQLNAQLIVESSQGLQVVLDGVSRSADYGTDMVFAVNSQASGLISSIGGDKVYLKVSSVLIKHKDLEASISLASDASNTHPGEQKIAMNSIKTAFDTRLEYKSGTKKVEAMKGLFSQEVLADTALLDNYAPAETTEKPMYSVQFLTYSMIDERTFYAVVNEVWKGVNGGLETHFYRTHKVISKKDVKGNWVIGEDKIVK